MAKSSVSSARARCAHRCTACGHEVAKWVGRCPDCQTWGSVAAVEHRPVTRVTTGTPTAPARPISQVDLHSARATATGVPELDRVLGGGLVPGSVVLLAGEPGVGKSTLLLEVAHRCATAGRRALYVTGEESAGQVRLRAERTGALHDELFLAAESDLAAVLGHLDPVEPALLIIDSVQTMSCSDAEGSPGGVAQVRAVASALITTAKERGLPVVLVGHVTKDGTVAGPRVLEHLVDVVLQFEGDRHSTLRMV
ncbi:MAG: AAA family ATPase, partial [Pseudonocardiaceae bacterium]